MPTKILEDTLNLKDVRIYDAIEDEEGRPKRVLNKTDTMLAQQKQQVIKDAFANWIWQDPQRRIALVKQYNELFNSNRPREYDGSHIHFVGMNPEISLREHQRNAIAHVLYGGNTLLAHEVGAGKTFEMAASAMEAKRLGLCQKSLFVVPNHLTEQWAAEFLHLYPNAKLLVARKKDFETANRKKFCARIATGDYDAVIIGHSQFERIPLSYERQERIIQEQIDETLAAINELKATAGENFSIKQMEKTRKTLEIKLEKLRSDARKDDVITFEQLGVDRLFVDESHFYKNLFLTTKMRNVAGLSTSEAQKSSDMFGKCRYLDEITGGRGVVFATGTPVSNSMSELYTVMSVSANTFTFWIGPCIWMKVRRTSTNAMCLTVKISMERLLRSRKRHWKHWVLNCQNQTSPLVATTIVRSHLMQPAARCCSRFPNATVWNWMKCQNTADGLIWKSRTISWQSKKNNLLNRKKPCRSKPSSLRI